MTTKARPQTVGRYSNAAMTLQWAPDDPPPGRSVPLVLPTPDRSATTGTLYTPPTRARAVVALTHPRVDMTTHYLIPPLVRAGYAVWAQRTRNVNNDLTTVHEQLLIDLAVAHQELRLRGYEDIYLLGNSGGASLYCFYIQQAARSPDDRLIDTPAGGTVDLTLDMPMPSGLVLLAPHPGQGTLLLHCIDPSVTHEDDGASLDSALSLFERDNGFHEPPESSSFSATFLETYRAAQVARVQRIDAIARDLLARRASLRREAKEKDDADLRRAALVPNFMTVYRTDADPRCLDLSLDPSKRDYGSIFGRRPDITNYGAVGFGRLTTPEAWLSTWSGLSSRASISMTAPEIDVPVLLAGYTADNSVFPSDLDAMERLFIGAKDVVQIDGDHYGFAPGTESRMAGREAATTIVSWLTGRP